MPAPLNIDQRREPSGSHLSSSSSSVVTLKLADSPSSSSELRRGPSPLSNANLTNGVSAGSQTSSLLATYPPRHLPFSGLAQLGITSPDGKHAEQQGFPGYTPSDISSHGLKRHLSFSKRFSFSPSANVVHGDSKQETITSSSPHNGHVKVGQLSMDDQTPKSVEVTPGPSWASSNSSPADERHPFSIAPSRSFASSPPPSSGHGRVPSTHDPYDYRKNSPEKAGPPQDSSVSLGQSSSRENLALNRTSSRYKGKEHVTGDKTPARSGVGQSSTASDARSPTALESRGTPTSSSTGRNTGHKDKKSMLSRALQRANDAVGYDNAQDYAAAKEAYEEACDFLSRVMGRSSNEDDKKRLMAIRATYTARIEELQQLGSRISLRSEESSDSTSQVSSLRASFDGASEEHTITLPNHDTSNFETAGRDRTRLDDEIYMDKFTYDLPGPSSTEDIPITARLHTREQENATLPSDSITSINQFTPTSLFSLSPLSEAAQRISPNFEQRSLPEESWKTSRTASQPSGESSSNLGAGRRPSQTSSNHSLSSVSGIRRKHIHIASGATEADFDAALDAAVEAVYDDGYELYNDNDKQVGLGYHSNTASNSRTFHDYDSYANRETVIRAAHARSAAQLSLKSADSTSELESENETDEEERILNDVTRKYMIDRRVLERQTKAIPPRQSDSSGSSGRTWASSGASSISTIATPLSPVDESRVVPPSTVQEQIRHLPPPAPPPTTALPRLPPDANVPGIQHIQHPGLQDRRSSGQRVKRLQIKTVASSKTDARSISTSDLSSSSDQLRSSASSSFVTQNSAIELEGGAIGNAKSSPTSAVEERGTQSSTMKQTPHTAMRTSIVSDFSPTTSVIPEATVSATKLSPSTASLSPNILLNRPRPPRPGATKNISSNSLMTRINSADSAEVLDASPDTPMSFGFTSIPPPEWKITSPSTIPTGPPPPVPHVDKVQLFANEMHVTGTPTSSSAHILHPPRPLEPCPQSCMQRPFWLLRCIYQTIAHPRGGYITKRLFVPREVWKTKNPRLKAVEDKILACDMLTPALLKLGHVNTLDADAVLEEFQALEAVMDLVQANLTKKLGNEVGVSNVSSLFKDAPLMTPIPTPVEKSETPTHSFNTDGGTNASSTGSFGKSSGKSSFNLSSWRKLRNRNSSTSLSASFSSAKDAPKESVVMPSLPMAGSNAEEPFFRGSRRSMMARPVVGAADAMKMEGPNAGYMAALARLCEAVQVLDQIARQVEDPGLKASSPTHVGLELSARHAAEFFGFYICRFVLQDVTVLSEKFIKRASEWVML